MGSKKEACRALGELFIIGIEGLDLAQDTAIFLSQAKIGGVILFTHNFESPAQVAELTTQIQECRSDFPLWVSTDHEGGRVQRFKKGMTLIPEAAAIGESNSPKLAFEIAEIMAKELKAIGVNLNFYPIGDIATNPKNPVIGNRAFGHDEELVSKMCTAMVRGHLVHQVQPCIKHFPGHGDTHLDSHWALPKIDTSLEVMRSREFKPFSKAFKSKCSIVMTAHIICSQIDPQFPATLSKKILKNLLREELRYHKVIITDDLEMKAITDHFGKEEAPLLALQAGCDLLLFRTESAARTAYDALYKCIEIGTLAPEVVLEAENRVKSLKRESLPPYHPIAISELGKQLATTEHISIINKILANRN